MVCELESKELLSFCLRRVRGLNKVRLVDASFVWTEPHSRRLKLKLTVQKEVFTSTILQQGFIVEYTIQNFYCPDCHKLAADDTWNSVAQVRQKIEHKRTFYWLEQMILRHNAHVHCTQVKETPEGLDFFFQQQNHCAKFVDFLQSIVPLRYKTSKKLVGQDIRSNIYTYKHTYSVEIAPVCRDDVSCLPIKVARSMGGISPIVLVWKVSNMLHFMDPLSMQMGELNSMMYWQSPFRSIASRDRLIEYYVVNVEPINNFYDTHTHQHMPNSVSRYQMAEVTVIRMDRNSGLLDPSGTEWHTRSHLGHVLKPGDTVLGYHLAGANFNDNDLEAMQQQRTHQIPDVILVRKTYPASTKRRKNNRHWKLKQLDKEKEQLERKDKHKEERAQMDYEQFLQDIEEDPELRSQLKLYKVPNAEKLFQQRQTQKPAEDEMVDVDQMDEDEDFPEIQLDDLLDEMKDLSISNSDQLIVVNPNSALNPVNPALASLLNENENIDIQQ
jgi:nonsense-mediated mRNA decay protein 3